MASGKTLKSDGFIYKNCLLIIMVYPQYKNKHAEAALFNPEDYVNWKKVKNPMARP